MVLTGLPSLLRFEADPKCLVHQLEENPSDAAWRGAGCLEGVLRVSDPPRVCQGKMIVEQALLVPLLASP